jgi:hypothetical protein
MTDNISNSFIHVRHALTWMGSHNTCTSRVKQTSPCSLVLKSMRLVEIMGTNEEVTLLIHLDIFCTQTYTHTNTIETCKMTARARTQINLTIWQKTHGTTEPCKMTEKHMHKLNQMTENTQIQPKHVRWLGFWKYHHYISAAHCAGRPRNPGLISGRGKMLLFPIKCRPALGPTLHNG